MFRLLFSALGTFLLAGALASLIVDAYDSFNAKHLVTNGLSSLFQSVIPAQYETFLSILSARFSPNLAHLIRSMLKVTPIFLVLGASSSIVLALTGKSKPKIGFSSR